MRVLLFQLDGKLPNLALMRIAAHHRALGDDVELRRTGRPDLTLFDLTRMPHKVYASTIFEWSRFIVDRLLEFFPTAIVGGSGVDGHGEGRGGLPPYRPDMVRKLEFYGIGRAKDYSDYPHWRQSVGFTQRGCRLNCIFCTVRPREGPVNKDEEIYDLWRGEPWPRELILLDNDFFGQADWREHIQKFRDGQFKVDFNQGINARFLTDEAAEAVASIDYRACTKEKKTGLYRMGAKRIYTAWDSRKDEKTLIDGIKRLIKYGIKPDNIMVYMLIGFDHATKQGVPFVTDDDFYRQQRLRDLGCRPYPMPFMRTSETTGFQRWVIGAYDKQQDKNYVPWHVLKSANYQPGKLGDWRNNESEKTEWLKGQPCSPTTK